MNGFTTLGAQLLESMVSEGLAIDALLTPDMLAVLENTALEIEAGNLPDLADLFSGI